MALAAKVQVNNTKRYNVDWLLPTHREFTVQTRQRQVICGATDDGLLVNWACSTQYFALFFTLWFLLYTVLPFSGLWNLLLTFISTKNLSQCLRDAGKPIAVPVCKLSVNLQPFNRSSFLECALQTKIAKINWNQLFYKFRVFQSHRCWYDWKACH